MGALFAGENSAPRGSSSIVKQKQAESSLTADLTVEERISDYKKNRKSSNSYSRWKRGQPFWIRKGIILLQLALFISLGVILGQMLEVGGIIKYIAVITTPILLLGRLPKITSAPFIMSLQSGAVANSMLANSRDEGELSNRQLYTSVLVVSCLSLFAHLPTYILPLALALGYDAALMFFSVRFLAIIAEIIVVLLVSNFIVRPRVGDTFLEVPLEERLEKREIHVSEAGYWSKVWKRSRRTIKRLLIYVVPSFIAVAMLEYSGAFAYLAERLPGLFSYSFLPTEAAAIIPAQAANLYNGIIAAGNFLEEGMITVKQAVVILLVGSLITAPLRTLKHALPTYIAVLGPRAGTVMAFSAQILRTIFVAATIFLMVLYW